jgi:PEP-CTERM motif
MTKGEKSGKTQPFADTRGQTVRNIVTNVAVIAGVIILTGVAAAAQGRGRGNGRPETPPGQERQVHSVPEPTTLTLIGIGAGGLLLRHWTSRRKKTER